MKTDKKTDKKDECFLQGYQDGLYGDPFDSKHKNLSSYKNGYDSGFSARQGL